MILYKQNIVKKYPDCWSAIVAKKILPPTNSGKKDRTWHHKKTNRDEFASLFYRNEEVCLEIRFAKAQSRADMSACNSPCLP